MTRLLVPAFVVVTLVSCSRAVPANVAAMVNGRAITYADIDKEYQSQFSASKDQPGGQPAGQTTDQTSGDQVEIQKLEVLRTLIDGEIMFQRAEKEGLMATDAEIDAKFNELKAPYTQEEFQAQLNSRKMTADDLRAQLRRDLSVAKLFNKEITSRIAITDKDIADFYNANKANFDLAEPRIRIEQILVTPTPDPNVRNLKNDKARDDAQAKKKIENLYERLKHGEDFTALAQNYSEDPNSSQNGGDLWYIPESAFEKTNADLRKVVMSLHPGEISAPLRTAEGYRILKVVTREPAGQRDLTDPKVQQTIRETLLNRKDQLLKAAYYEMARSQAKVVNYFAQRMVEDKEKK
ncbi:MAG: peptidylprolyl isomerase [Bryobacteraceae bacterium]